MPFVGIQTSKGEITGSRPRALSLVSQPSLHSPAFVTDNNALIFEEHQICSSANMYNILQTIESVGLFVEDENKFIFSNVLVGHQAKARFKISNMGKIACDVNMVVKPVSNKVSSPPRPAPAHRGWQKARKERLESPAWDYLALWPCRKLREGTG